MPNMFARRRGTSTSTPPVDPVTYNAAAAAAGSAFRTNSLTAGSLSSAAAAAALRTHATSPEPVGSIQTKRMVRRGSVSSIGSGSVLGGTVRGGGARPGLQRNTSSSSMTERTFRSPSPGRTNGVTSPDPDAPPIPPVPRDISTTGHKRASSLEPPQRVTSPTPRGRGGRGSSLDRASLPPPPSNRLSKRLSGVLETEETERQSGNGSSNYSRPMAPQQATQSSSEYVGTGGAKRYTHGTGSWFSQPGGSGSAANARPSSRSGMSSTLAVQSPTGLQAVSYDTQDTIMEYDPNSRTFVARPRPKPAIQPASEPKATARPTTPSQLAPQAQPAPQPGHWDPNTRSIVPARTAIAQPAPAVSGSASNDAPNKKKQKPAVPPVATKLEPPPRNPARLSPTSSSSPASPRMLGMLQKQPSMVREDPEAEEAAAKQTPLKPTGGTITTSAGPAKAYVAPTAITHQRSTSLDIPRQRSTDGAGRGRNGSMSPSRSAHFSVSPVIEAMRHDPPPRSVSPAKSALKHSPNHNARPTSPMAFSSLSGAANKVPPSDASDVGSETSEVGVKKEKKKARVSFDEQPQEIDAAGAVASPKAITAAPNALSNASASRRDLSHAVEDDDFDSATLKQRPALPSFASARRPARAEMPEKVTEMAPEREPVGISSDHAVSQAFTNAKPEPAAQPKAPEVANNKQSAAADDYVSEDESSFQPDISSTPAKPAANAVDPRRVSVDEADGPVSKTRDFATEAAQRLAPAADPVPEPTQETVKNATEVPAINLLPPTPGEEPRKNLGEEDHPNPRSSMEQFVVPGGWSAEEGSDDKVAAAISSAQPATATEPTPAPEPKTLSNEAPLIDYRRPSPILDALTEESDDNAEFSDAAEDLSDLDDGGFASLDAIVSSPVVPSPSDKGKAPEVLETPTKKAPAEQAFQNGAEAADVGDWSQATAYWSQLSKAQREEIERQHLSSDDEATPAPTVAKRKKKTVPKASGSPTIVARPQDAPLPQQPSMPRTMRAKPGPNPAPATAPAPTPAAGHGPDSDVHLRRSLRGNTTANAGEAMPRTLRSHPSQQPRPQSEVIQPSRRSDVSQRPMSAGGSGPQPSRLGVNGLPVRPRTTRMDSEDSIGTPIASQDSAFPKMQAKRQAAMAGQKQTPPTRTPAPVSSTKAVPPPGAYTAKLQRKVTGGEDSDSESSFKKRRQRTNVDTSGRYNMRRSMRSTPVDEPQGPPPGIRPSSPPPGAPRGGGAFSIRSLSPSGGSVFGRGRGEKLRESLRSGSVDAGAGRRTTMRGDPPGGGAGRGARAVQAAPAPAKPRFRSRFGDSDDEGESARPGRSLFKSRFADSDDEDEPRSPRVIPADLTPVRGIPRKQGQNDGDSTDLEDEEDEDEDPRKASRKRAKQNKPIVPNPADVEKAMEAARRKLGIAAPTAPTAPAAEIKAPETHQGEALSKGSLRTPATATGQSTFEKRQADEPQFDGIPEKKRRGFMGSILKRNRDSSTSVQQRFALPSSPAAASPPMPSSPQMSTVPQEPKSAIERPMSPSPFTKLVRRSSQQPKPVQRGDSSFSTATAPATLHRKASDQWPLTPPVPAIPTQHLNGERDRPTTSDSANTDAIRILRTMRPDAGDRSASSGQMPGLSRRESAQRSVGFAPGSKESDGGSQQGDVGKVQTQAPAAEVYSRRTGKKKKFGMLRRAFGLND
ncbi:hypothetical protein BAUCODRAFT_25995 [Baudoinia panamericana UAMH 10762]|uniref:Uncharacterized protein n=1 Tax=Baudoinia panamericana (strain UAMH 10762) TaxID=717646 RepID=M2MB61_BAUPA|nr:uncharacterized protein BAUCODRAFT_25995 [Baudoinia panamericana UAMH 10762]EMC93721.1 hypothetical protein BAUCODRAFT_25995 [Baudoinia panamericana UAMH 10762]